MKEEEGARTIACPHKVSWYSSGIVQHSPTLCDHTCKILADDHEINFVM